MEVLIIGRLGMGSIRGVNAFVKNLDDIGRQMAEQTTAILDQETKRFTEEVKPVVLVKTGAMKKTIRTTLAKTSGKGLITGRAIMGNKGKISYGPFTETMPDSINVTTPGTEPGAFTKQEQKLRFELPNIVASKINLVPK